MRGIERINGKRAGAASSAPTSEVCTFIKDRADKGGEGAIDRERRTSVDYRGGAVAKVEELSSVSGIAKYPRQRCS